MMNNQYYQFNKKKQNNYNFKHKCKISNNKFNNSICNCYKKD